MVRGVTLVAGIENKQWGGGQDGARRGEGMAEAARSGDWGACACV